MTELDHVALWGRSFDEYRRMFSLSDRDLLRKMVGVGDGPASFNAEACAVGASIISCDPLYQFDAADIAKRIDDVFPEVMTQLRANQSSFRWQEIASVTQLGELRRRAMDTFLRDYAQGRGAGRYVAASLPELPFEDDQFELAVCSHLLFTYASQLDQDFHEASIREMLRVAGELRVFPLLGFDGKPVVFLKQLVTTLKNLGHRPTIEQVAYEFQVGGNEMLRVVRG